MAGRARYQCTWSDVLPFDHLHEKHPGRRNIQHRFRNFVIISTLSLAMILCVQLVPTPSLPSLANKEGMLTSRQVEGRSLEVAQNFMNWRLLVSSQNRLFWYDPKQNEEVTLHQGEVSDTA